MTRAVVFWVVGGAVLAALLVAEIATGSLPLSPQDVFAAFVGRADPGTTAVVLDWRLPRAVLGAAMGAALALSGGLFQTITRNPLGSPDVLGFSAGAQAGAVVVIIGGVAGTVTVSAGAVAGGLGAAALVALLGGRRGGAGLRFILVGIGVTALAGAITSLLLTSVDERTGLTAAIWGTGSLNGVDAEWIPPVAAVTVLGALVVLGLRRALEVHDLGDDLAGGLGVALGPLRIVAAVTGVALVAISAAAAGPIAFVALAAPQIARLARRSGGVPFAAAALIGAVLLVGSDVVAQRLLAPTILPTGVVTVCVGGAYLAAMLAPRGHRHDV